MLAANIAKVNGLVFSTAPAFTGLLDTYTGAAAAYSTRRLYSLYTGAALRVREGSGDTETDIGFDSNGDLDTAAIATHCGSANGYVTKWYGQESSGGTGSGNDAEQATAGSQPQIYNGSAVITDNGKPALDGNEDFLSFTSITLTSDFAISHVGHYRSQDAIYGGSSGNFGGYGLTGYLRWRISGSNLNYTVTYSANQQYLDFFNRSSGSNTLHIDGASKGTISNSNTFDVSQLMGGGGAGKILGKYQEFILWDSDQSSNRTGIEGNVNAHFQIGNFGTPTSGLLYDYSGAAAAYSVRQLANTAALAMRIREDGTDTETDIGFDSNGDLDTAAIASHCGSNNGYVVTWYDQAGSQVDATQGTSGSQPQIYNGTAVITKNGKPALDYDKSNQTHLSFATSALNGKYPDFFMVLTVDSYSQFGTSTLSQTTSGNYYTQLGLTNTFYVQGSSAGGTGVNVADSQQRLIEMYADGTDIFAVYDTTSYSRTTSTSAYPSGTLTFRIGKHTSTAWDMDGQLQEYVLWPDNQTSSNRSGIETNINNYFSVF